MFLLSKKITFSFNTIIRGVICNRFMHYERKVNVNGTNINIVESGNGPKSLLLMPGALGSGWTDFRPQIEKLPALIPDYTIVAWDPPGYGKSIPPTRKFDLDCFHNDAKVATDLMSTLQRPVFSVVGWSDGGITGLIMAGKFQENIEKLIIWGAGAYINSEEVKMLQSIKDVEKWSQKMRAPMEEVYGKEGFAQLWSEWVDSSIRFYDQKNGNFCKEEICQVKAPTFILHGKKDPMIAAEHIPFLRESLASHKYYEFPDGKHNIHLRYADEFNKLIADFLNEKK